MKKVLLMGATGATGKHVLEGLLNDSFFTEVYTISRRPLSLKHPKLHSLLVDFEQLEQLPIPSMMENLDQLYFCYGTTLKQAGGKEAFTHIEWDLSLKILHLAQKLNVKKVLLVSSLGANSKSAVLYQRIKGQIEEYCQKLAFKELVIFRPSILLTPREVSRTGEEFMQMMTKPLSKVFDRFLPQYAPVKTEVLAHKLIVMGKTMDLPSVTILENREIISK
ncbi:MAG: NAD(P)H-binding protein [Bacteriovoracaceae bacterium]